MLGAGALLRLPSNTSAMSQSTEAANPFAYEHETTAAHAASQDHTCHHLLRRCSLPGGDTLQQPPRPDPNALLDWDAVPCPGLAASGAEPSRHPAAGTGPLRCHEQDERGTWCWVPSPRLFPRYLPHGIPAVQSGLPGPSPRSTAERCQERRPCPGPGSGSGIAPAPWNGATPCPHSPPPHPPAGRRCHPGGAELDPSPVGVGLGGVEAGTR